MKKQVMNESAGGGYTLKMYDVLVFSGKKADILDVDVKDFDNEFVLYMTVKIPSQKDVEWEVSGYDFYFTSERNWDGEAWEDIDYESQKAVISGGKALLPWSVEKGFYSSDLFLDKMIEVGFKLEDAFDYEKIEKDGKTVDEVLEKVGEYVDYSKIVDLLNQDKDKTIQLVSIMIGEPVVCNLDGVIGSGWGTVHMDKDGVELSGTWDPMEEKCGCVLEGPFIDDINGLYDWMWEERLSGPEDEEEDE